MKAITPETVNCPKCKRGVLFDVTPMLGVALGHKHVKCDRCGYRHGFKVVADSTPEVRS